MGREGKKASKQERTEVTDLIPGGRLKDSLWHLRFCVHHVINVLHVCDRYR